MGTTMAFYNILNKGFTANDLQNNLKLLSTSSKKPSPIVELYNNIIQQMNINTEKLKDEINRLQAQSGTAIVAYKESAKWLPFYEVNKCDGYIASSNDTLYLSEIFKAPVIAFSLFDSDILFVSYSDAASGISYDYAKPNFEDFEEYDTEIYSTEFPEFLLSYCNYNDLKEIWDEPDVVFADDRMVNISQLIQAELIYDIDEIPDGYQVIHTP